MSDRAHVSPADLAAAQRAATRFYGRPAAGVERVASFNNRVLRLRFDGDLGDKILKLARPGDPAPALVREPQVVAVLRQNGLPVPRVEHEDLTGRLAGRPLFVMASAGDRTAGDLSGLSTPNRRRLFRNVGRLLAAVHNIPFVKSADFSGRKLVAARFERSPLEPWHRDQIDYARRRGLLDADALDETESLLPELPEARRPTMCHGDFNPAQCVRVGPSVTAIVDWEGGYVGDPMYDYAVFDLLLDLSAPADLAREGRAAYAKARPLPPGYEATYRPYKMAHAVALVSTYHAARRDGPLRAARAAFNRLAKTTRAAA